MPFPVSGTPPPSAMVGTDVGSAPPPFTMRLSNGSAVASDALVAAGRPVFMMYFATW